MLQPPDEVVTDADQEDGDSLNDYPTAFSLARFIPLLTERIHVINPFTRIFLVSWITLLDSIPDLELVFYLPAFLGGLFKFLSDPNKDVQVATQGCLERFLAEIKQIASIKKGIEENKKSQGDDHLKRSISIHSTRTEGDGEKAEEKQDHVSGGEGSPAIDDLEDEDTESDYVPGQDVYVDHPKILEILVTFLDSTAGMYHPHGLLCNNINNRGSEEEIRLTALRWIGSFFEICPEDILPFVPRLLSQVLPAMASEVDEVRQAAHRVNNSLLEYIVSLPEEPRGEEQPSTAPSKQSPSISRDGMALERRESAAVVKQAQSNSREVESKKGAEAEISSPPPASAAFLESKPDLDYSAAINALTLQFMNEHETTRAAALNWLIMLHRKAPRKVK